MNCFIISLASSSLILPIIIFLARKFNITDKPDSRKQHKEPIPLLGGLGIFLSFALTMLMCIEYRIDLLYLIIYSGIIATIGTIDDVKDINAIYKMIIEIICAMLIILSGIRLHIGIYFGWYGPWIYLIEMVISVIWIVGITNAINIIDGLDGLAGGISLIASAAFAMLFIIYDFNLLKQISLILIGSLIGFLVYNFYPAKLFMGDGGSLFIGFLLSILSIKYVNSHKEISSLWVPIIILGVPIFETGSSILRRLAKRSKIMKADAGHMHNKLIDRGLSQIAAVFIIYAWAILAGVFGVFIALGNQLSLALFIIILLIAIAVKKYI